MRGAFRAFGWTVLPALLAAGPAAAEQQLVIKSKGVPDPALTALIAEIGQAQAVDIKAGQRPLDLITARCGNNFSYLALAEQQVPDLAPYVQAASDRTVELPACLSPGEPGRVVAVIGDDVTALSQKYGVSFRPELTDWADLPGIPQADEAAVLRGLDQRFDALSVRRPSVTDFFGVNATSFSPADPTGFDPGGRPPIFQDLISPASLSRNETLDAPDFTATGTVRGQNFTIVYPPGVLRPGDTYTPLPQDFARGQLVVSGLRPATGDTMISTASTPVGDSAVVLTSLEPSGVPLASGARGITLASGAFLPGSVQFQAARPDTEAEMASWLGANAATAQVFALRVEPRLPAFQPQTFTAEDFSKWRQVQTSFAGILNNGQIRFENGLDSNFGIAADKTYVLPDAVPVWQTIRLKPGVTAEAFEAARTALAARDPAAASALAALGLVEAPQQFHNIGDEQCGPDRGVPPYDAAALLRQIGWNESLRQDTGRPPFDRLARLLVLDNGFPKLTTAALDTLWPQDLRGIIQLPASGTFSALSVGQDARPDFRLNAATRSLDTEVPANYPDDPTVRPSGRWHGLAVSMTALGGVPFEAYRRVTRLPLRMAFVGMVDEGGLQATAVNTAVRMAVAADVHVINASFSFPSFDQNLKEAIEAMTPRMLLVVAAGNDGKDLNTTESYPPKFGGRSTEAGDATVITVGMSRFDGTIHPRSSRSKTYVDLLAPGCSIGSYSIEGEGEARKVVRTRWTGTSFAAPLTAFAAALLDSYGLSPRVIKARLIYSADFTPPTEEAPQSSVASGVLNIERALAFPFNQYVLKDGRTLIDTVDLLDRPETRLCGGSFPLVQVARLSIRDGKAYYMMHPNNPETGQLLDRESCTLKDGDTLSFDVTDYASGDTVTIGLETLTDFIGRGQIW